MKKALFLCLLLPCLALSGCQSLVQKHEITDLAIVIALGLDAAPEGRLQVSLLVRSGSDARDSRLYTQEGRTITECLHQLTEACEHIPFFGHTEMIFIGPSLWEEDVCSKLDWFVRSSRLRQECTLNAVQGTSARDFLQASLNSSVFVTDAVLAIYEPDGLFHLSEDSRISHVMLARNDPTTALLIPCLAQDASQEGTFVPRFASYLLLCGGQARTLTQPGEAMGLHLLRGEPRSLRIQTRDAAGALLMLESRSLSTRMELLSGEPLQARFHVRVEASVLEYYGQEDPSLPAAREGIEREAEVLLLERGQAAIDLLQREGADVLGLWEAWHRRAPEAAEAAQSRWGEILGAADLALTVDVVLVHSNQLGAPLGASGEGSAP